MSTARAKNADSFFEINFDESVPCLNLYYRRKNDATIPAIEITELSLNDYFSATFPKVPAYQKAIRRSESSQHTNYDVIFFYWHPFLSQDHLYHIVNNCLSGATDTQKEKLIADINHAIALDAIDTIPKAKAPPVKDPWDLYADADALCIEARRLALQKEDKQATLKLEEAIKLFELSHKKAHKVQKGPSKQLQKSDPLLSAGLFKTSQERIYQLKAMNAQRINECKADMKQLLDNNKTLGK